MNNSVLTNNTNNNNTSSLQQQLSFFGTNTNNNNDSSQSRRQSLPFLPTAQYPSSVFDNQRRYSTSSSPGVNNNSFQFNLQEPSELSGFHFQTRRNTVEPSQSQQQQNFDQQQDFYNQIQQLQQLQREPPLQQL